MTALCFRWSAQDPRGRFHSGLRMEDSERECRSHFKYQHWRLQACQSFQLSVLQRQFSQFSCLQFFTALHAVLSAGIALFEALQILSKQAQSLYVQYVLCDLEYRLRTGASFAESLKAYPRHFDGVSVQLIRVAEQTGRLESMLAQLGHQETQRQELKRAVQQALFYPTLLAVLTLIVIGVVILWVLPAFASLFQEFKAPLPAFTQALLNLSGWLLGNTDSVVAILFSVCVLPVFIGIQFPRVKNQVRRLFLSLPLCSRIDEAHQLWHLNATLKVCLQAGLGFGEAINLAKPFTRGRTQKRLTELILQLQAGVGLGDAIEMVSGFPLLMQRLLSIGEISGQLEVMLERLERHFQAEFSSGLKRLTQLLEPALMLILGGLVGGLMMALYAPMLSLGRAL